MVKNKCKIISILSCRFSGTEKYVLPKGWIFPLPCSQQAWLPVRERSLRRSETELERAAEKVELMQLISPENEERELLR